jgi:hypothetical protein
MGLVMLLLGNAVSFLGVHLVNTDVGMELVPPLPMLPRILVLHPLPPAILVTQGAKMERVVKSLAMPRVKTVDLNVLNMMVAVCNIPITAPTGNVPSPTELVLPQHWGTQPQRRTKDVYCRQLLRSRRLVYLKILMVDSAWRW